MAAHQMDFMGDVLGTVFDFYDAGFNPTITLDDTVKQCRASAEELFPTINGRWHLRSPSLPGDPSLCAIAIDDAGLYIEAGTFDEKIFDEMVRKHELPYRFNRDTRIITDEAGERVVHISAAETFAVSGGTLDPRCLCTVLLKPLSGPARHRMIELFDRMFTKGVFVPGESALGAMGGSSGSYGTLSQELNFGLIQALELVQQPIMSIRTEQRLEMKAEQTMQQRMLQLQGMFALQQRVLRMDRAQLVQFTVEQIQQRGEPAVAHLYSFIIAGKIKRMKPALTWKSARSIARRMMSTTK